MSKEKKWLTIVNSQTFGILEVDVFVVKNTPRHIGCHYQNHRRMNNEL